MSARGGLVFKLAATAALVVGALLLAASWDGLYDALDLPQPGPALVPQIGGAAMVGLAYVLWSAAGDAALTPVAAGAGAVTFAVAAVTIAAWLLFRDPQEDLGIDTLGIVLLAGAAVVLAVLGAAIAREARPPHRPG